MREREREIRETAVRELEEKSYYDAWGDSWGSWGEPPSKKVIRVRMG
jgi:hypothetical protein